MYCRRCGKEMGESDAFCPQCGTKAANDRPRSSSELKVPKIHEILNHSRIARLGGVKWHFCAGILLFAVCTLLAGKEMILFEYDVWYYGDSVSVGLLEEYSFLRFLYRAAYFAALAWAVYPMIRDEEWQKHHLMPVLVVAVLGIALVGITLLSGVDAVGTAGKTNGLSSWDWVDITIGLTTEGWIFLVASIMAVVLLYKTSKEIVSEQTQYRQRAEEERLCADSENGVKTHVRCPHCGRVQKSVSSFCEECFSSLV